MAFPSQGEETRRYTLFEAGYAPYPNRPQAWTMGAHNSGANIKGEMGFGAKIAKAMVGRPKGVCSKNYISGSQGRLTFSSCMKAIKSLGSLYQYWFGSEAEAKYFQRFSPWSTRKVGNMAKMPMLGYIYAWHIQKLKDPW